MCHPSVLLFGYRVLTAAHVTGRAVLEVGSYNVNGSLRPHVLRLAPAGYLGVDCRPGPGVDRIIDITAPLPDPAPQFDLLLTTEMLEHVADWRAAVTNLKALLRPGGQLLLTTRSRGFPLHEFPGDYWRFEVADMQAIFADFTLDVLEPDWQAPGVCLFATKPAVPGPPVDLAPLALYSMQAGARVR